MQQYRPKTYLKIRNVRLPVNTVSELKLLFSISCSKSLTWLVYPFGLTISDYMYTFRALHDEGELVRYSYSTLLYHWSDVFLDALNFPYPQIQGLYQKFKYFSRIFKNQGLFKTTSKIQGLFKAFIRNSSTFQGFLKIKDFSRQPPKFKDYSRLLSEIQVLFKDF